MCTKTCGSKLFSKGKSANSYMNEVPYKGLPYLYLQSL